MRMLICYLVQFHLVAEAGSDAVWLFGSSLRVGARPFMLNALSAVFAIGSGLEVGEYTFARYGDMPLGARVPSEVENMAETR